MAKVYKNVIIIDSGHEESDLESSERKVRKIIVSPLRGRTAKTGAGSRG